MKWILYIFLAKKMKHPILTFDRMMLFYVGLMTVTTMEPENQIFIEGNLLFACVSVTKTNPPSLMLLEWFYFLFEFSS
jgi:hypothetical protein